MLDLLSTVTTFTDHSTSPSPRGVQMRPIIRPHVSHTSWERIQVEVHWWTRGDRPLAEDNKRELVTLSEANTICDVVRERGWIEEKWS